MRRSGNLAKIAIIFPRFPQHDYELYIIKVMSQNIISGKKLSQQTHMRNAILKSYGRQYNSPSLLFSKFVPEN